MRFTHPQRLTPVQQSLAAEVIPTNVMGATLVYESKDAMSQSLTTLRSETLGGKAGRLRCLRSIIYRVEQMIENPHGYEHQPVPTTLLRCQKPEANDLVVTCTIQQTQYLRDVMQINEIRWASGSSKKSKFFVQESKIPELVQKMQDMYQDEILPQYRRVISTIAKKLGTVESPVIITSADSAASQDRLNCLAYACQKAGVPFDRHAVQLDKMISTKDLDPILDELKLIAALVAGSSRICWNLISKLERLRGNVLTETAHAQFALEIELSKDMMDGPSAWELEEAALYEEEIKEEPPVVEPSTESEVDGIDMTDEEDDGPNCFFADDQWEQYEETDLDDEGDEDATWFVYMNISNCLSLLDIADDERYQVDGDDISFKKEVERDEWCEEMRLAIEDLVEFDELDQEGADMCMQEINALDNMTSIL